LTNYTAYVKVNPKKMSAYTAFHSFYYHFTFTGRTRCAWGVV
jgi:hypothetical protein